VIAAAGLVLNELPCADRWDFGASPYGLEPLTLPPAGARQTIFWRSSRCYDGACRRIEEITSGRGRVDGIGLSDPAVELAWFRWITGHQVSFIVWRLMAELLWEVDDDPRVAGQVARPLRDYVRGYSAMLLYSGSCPRSTYEAVIRPSMRLQHPGFSGRWAPDFAPVKTFLRSRRSEFVGTPDAAALNAAVKTLQAVHDAVAAKLVPDGKSLLRQSHAPVSDIRLLHALYDNYFMTLRGGVDADDVVCQLLRRLVAIAQDLAVNGLHPCGWEEGDEVGCEMLDLDVLECEEQLTDIVRRVATTAAAPGDAGPASPLAGGPAVRVRS
jgi:L-tyrosine peroxygenase